MRFQRNRKSTSAVLTIYLAAEVIKVVDEGRMAVSTAALPSPIRFDWALERRADIFCTGTSSISEKAIKMAGAQKLIKRDRSL
jgi:hypothetical protein